MGEIVGGYYDFNHCKTNEDGEPELHYIRLPRDIANDYVVLMDPIVGTGSAAMMAIRVLLDHDVKEDKIILVSLLMAECGSQGNLKPFGFRTTLTSIGPHLGPFLTSSSFNPIFSNKLLLSRCENRNSND